MKIYFIYLVLSFVTMGLLTSCDVAYIPSMQNVPLLTRSGEVDISLSPTNFQAAVSPFNHFGLMVNGMQSRSSWDEHYEARRRMIEGAIGYYHLNPEKRIVEVYLGGGTGSIHFEDDYLGWDHKLDANLTRFFLQPSIGYRNDYFEVAFSTRLLKIDFYGLETVNYSDEDLEADDLKDIDRQPYYFFEPAITFRFGYKNIKGQLQYLYSYKINNDPLNAYKQVINAGINLHF